MKRVILAAICARGGVPHAEATTADRGKVPFQLFSVCNGDQAEGREIGQLRSTAIAGLKQWYADAQ